MNGIPEFGNVHSPHKTANNKDYLGQQIRELVKLDLKGSVGLVFLSSLDLLANATDGSLNTGVGDDTDSIALVDGCGAEKHVLLVLEHLCVSTHGVTSFCHAHRFSSKSGLACVQ